MKAPLRGILLAATALAAASAVGAQVVTPAANYTVSIEQRLNGRLDPQTRASVLALVDSAQRSGLPTDPIVLWALEGAAKHASPAVILNALRGLMADLGTARAALGPDSSPDEIAAGAQALRLGVKVRALQQYKAVRPKHPTIALSTIYGFVADGVHPDTAVQVVLALLQHAATDDQLLSLKNDVERDIRANIPPATALAVRGDGIERMLASTPPANGGGARGVIPLVHSSPGAPGAASQGQNATGPAAVADKGQSGATIAAPDVVPPPRPKPPPKQSTRRPH